MPNGDISPVVPKREESREDNISSLDSPQEDDAHADRRESLSTRLGPDGSPILKRKGGRKPVGGPRPSCAHLLMRSTALCYDGGKEAT